MKFKGRLECEGKTRAEHGHDYSAAIKAISAEVGPIVPIGSPYLILDAYFDTPDGLLQQHDHRFRVRWRPNRRTRYNFKTPLERDNYLVVCREMTARMPAVPYDFGNPLHQRLPLLAHLSAFLDRVTHGHADQAIAGFAPRIMLMTTRTSYAVMSRASGGPAMFALIDRTHCAEWRPDRPEPSGSFSELELELPVGNISPASLDFLRGRLATLAELGYPPTRESKYVHAYRRVFCAEHAGVRSRV
jgi:hypothetical protein